MNTPMVQSTLSCPSSYNTTANNNNNNNIALTLDQTQLQQITQLMNEMQQQDLNFIANNNAIENTNISIDVTNHTNHTENSLNQNQLIFSPDSIVKLENNIQFQQSAAYQMTSSMTNQALVDNQQQQLTQVHTIMLNGQPALFIPASSAMSSNLLSQMLMNNNGALVNTETQSSTMNTTHNINNSNNNQTFDLNSINLPFNSVIQQMPESLNQTNEDIITSNKNAQSTLKHKQNSRQISPKRQKNNSNSNLNQNTSNSTNQLLLQQQQQQQQQFQQQQQSQIINLSQFLSQSSSNSSDVSNFLLNMNGVNIDLESLVSSNMQQQQQQQIICIQPDGNLVFQTIQQPSFQQQTFQETNAFTTLDNKLPNEPNSNNNKKRKNAKTSTPSNNNETSSVNSNSKKTKTNTVACVLANGIQVGDLPAAKMKKNYKVANLLSSSENKLKDDSIVAQQMLQIQSDPNTMQQEQQQWVLINNSNNLNQLASLETFISTNENNNENKSTFSKQKDTKKEKTVKDEVNELMKLYNSIGNDDNVETSKNDTSNDTENKDDGSLLENENGDKKKRKACECPNCLKWKHNAEYREENLHKRTHSCHKCPKVYNKTSHLRAHLRAHDNYRPYVCDYAACRKSFTRSDELKRHKRIHNDDRNFPCTLCKKKFLRSDHLAKHYLVHKKTITTAQASLIPSPKKLQPQKQIRKLISEQEIKREEEASSIASSSSSASSTTE